MNASAIITMTALVVVVFTTSVFMGQTFRPRVPLQTRYTLTNAVETVPLGVLIAQFLEFGTSNENTRRAYRVALEHLCDFMREELGRKPELLNYSQLSFRLISAFRDARVERGAAKSADLHLSVVKKLCRWATDRFGVPNPASGVKSVKLNAPEFKGLNEKQYRSLLATVKEEPDFRKRYVVRLGIWSGMRNDEIRNTLLGQLSDNYRYFLNVEGKSTAKRDIPISADLRLATAEYMLDRDALPSGPTRPLFYSERSALVSNKTIWNWVNEVCLKAGIPEKLAHPHALRHTYAHRTLALLTQNGEEFDRAIRQLMAWLGHRSIETTMQYLGLERHDQRMFQHLQRVEDY